MSKLMNWSNNKNKLEHDKEYLVCLDVKDNTYDLQIYFKHKDDSYGYDLLFEKEGFYYYDFGVEEYKYNKNQPKYWMEIINPESSNIENVNKINVLEKLNNGEYVNRKQWIPYEIDQLASNEYDAENERIENEFKNDLLEQYNMNNEKGQKILYVAWRDGHSRGYEYIYEKFIEYKDLSDKEIEDLQ